MQDRRERSDCLLSGERRKKPEREEDRRQNQPGKVLPQTKESQARPLTFILYLDTDSLNLLTLEENLPAPQDHADLSVKTQL